VRYVNAYLGVAGGVIVLTAIQVLLTPPLAVGIALAIGISSVVIWANRKVLDVADTFPELLRVPLLRRFLAG
jgi:hypothetical protein